jgi:hypothetical protein
MNNIANNIALTFFGHGKNNASEISVSYFPHDNDSPVHTSNTSAYCDMINSLNFSGDAWCRAIAIKDNERYPVSKPDVCVGIEIINEQDDALMQSVLKKFDIKTLLKIFGKTYNETHVTLCKNIPPRKLRKLKKLIHWMRMRDKKYTDMEVHLAEQKLVESILENANKSARRQ